MTDRSARRLAWSAFALYLVLFVAGLVLDALARLRIKHTVGSGGDFGFLLVTTAFPIVAVLILSKQPRNRIGWILMAIGIAWVIGPGSLGDFLISRGHSSGGALAIAISGPTWVPPIILMGTTLLLRFPDGKLLSPRWKLVEWTALVATV